jgi:hypothetical protein
MGAQNGCGNAAAALWGKDSRDTEGDGRTA